MIFAVWEGRKPLTAKDAKKSRKGREEEQQTTRRKATQRREEPDAKKGQAEDAKKGL